MKAQKHASIIAIINSHESSPIDFSFALILAMANSHKKSTSTIGFGHAKAHKKNHKHLTPLLFHLAMNFMKWTLMQKGSTHL
jgi:hypothetical protein